MTMSITNANQQVDEANMLLISQLYPDVYTQIVSRQVSASTTKPRRRRKKSKNGEGALAKKRKLTEEQVTLLELNFGNEHKLEGEKKDRLAAELGLDPRQVAVWFQNRRARWKNKKLEEEYSILKSVHENVVVEKRKLESEMQKFKEKLSEAEKEIKKMSDRAEGGGGGSSNSPSSSLSIEENFGGPLPFFGEFGVEEYDDVFYMPQNNYNINAMEWMSPYM